MLTSSNAVRGYWVNTFAIFVQGVMAPAFHCQVSRAEPLRGTVPAVCSFLLAGNRTCQPALPDHCRLEMFPVREPGDLAPGVGGGHNQGVQSTIHTNPWRTSAALCCAAGCRSAAAVCGCLTDTRSRLIPGSVTDRAIPSSPTRMHGLPLFGYLLRPRNYSAALLFFLNRRPPPASSPYTLAGARKRAQGFIQVDGSFLKHLRRHFATPPQARDLDLSITCGVYREGEQAFHH